ncbi:hypothetical protein BH11ARM2_BH11ARM2_17170 [soil metagenome]
MNLLGSLLGRRDGPPKLPTEAEYWVFVREARLPDHAEILRRLLHENPYGKARNPIGTGDAILFSDVRWHTALVLREKNALAFRPDVLAGAMTERAGQDAVLDAKAFIRLRYHSDVPLEDRRYLRLLVHTADAYLDILDGLGVYDQTAERFFTPSSLKAALQADPVALSPSLHLRRGWRPEAEGEAAYANGFLKVGLPNIQTEPVSRDATTLIEQVFERLTDEIWNAGEMKTEVELYEDRFQAIPTYRKNGSTLLRILRHHQL